MKLVKQVKRYCKHCKKHTAQKVAEVKGKTRSTSHPLSRGGKTRMRKRGLRRGYGNYGKYSRPTKPKRSGAKGSKKTNLKYTCTVCKKITLQGKGFRAKKTEFK